VRLKDVQRKLSWNEEPFSREGEWFALNKLFISKLSEIISTCQCDRECTKENKSNENWI